mmetsp:Transcript_13606/g.20294  ORF Transcript_13606/g.20294 Transcript_13606/m.20294 type:complete len:488 (-) Transcript_13606:172-1635(-)
MYMKVILLHFVWVISSSKDEIIVVFENPHKEPIELLWLDRAGCSRVGFVAAHGMLKMASVSNHEIGWRRTDKQIGGLDKLAACVVREDIPAIQRHIVNEKTTRIVLTLADRPPPTILFDTEVAAIDEAMRFGRSKKRSDSLPFKSSLVPSDKQRNYYYYINCADLEAFKSAFTFNGQYSTSEIFWPFRWAERTTTFGTNMNIDALAFEWRADAFVLIQHDSDCVNELLCGGIITYRRHDAPSAHFILHSGSNVPSPLLLEAWRHDARYISDAVHSSSIPKIPRILTIGCGPQPLVLGLELSVRARLSCYDPNPKSRHNTRHNAKNLALGIQLVNTLNFAWRRPHVIILSLPLHENDSTVSDIVHQSYNVWPPQKPSSDASKTLEKLFSKSYFDPAQVLNNTQNYGSTLLIHGSAARLAQLQFDYSHNISCEHLTSSSVPSIACRSTSSFSYSEIRHQYPFFSPLTSLVQPFQRRGHHHHQQREATLL